MSTDPFWQHIDQQLSDLRSAKTADDVFRICPTVPDLAASNAQGFFGGGGGDGTVLDALLDSGWTPVCIDAWYYWVLLAPNGDQVTYVEGDIYRGDQMLPHGEPETGYTAVEVDGVKVAETRHVDLTETN